MYIQTGSVSRNFVQLLSLGERVYRERVGIKGARQKKYRVLFLIPFTAGLNLEQRADRHTTRRDGRIETTTR